MQFRNPVMIALALGGGIAASIGLANYMSGPVSVQAPDATTRIYVALRDLEEGEALNERNVRLSHWPARGLPPGALTQLDEWKNRQTGGRILAGQPIQRSQLRTPQPVELVPTPAPEQKFITLEVPRDSEGPWIVSRQEQPVLTPLTEIWREAVELARRSEPSATTPVATESATDEAATDTPNSQPAAVEPALPTPTVAALPPRTPPTAERDVNSAPADEAATLPPAPVRDYAYSSSILTPEGAKVMRWNKSSDRAERPATPTREVSTDSAPDQPITALGQPLTLVGETLDGQTFDWNVYRGRPLLVAVCLVRDGRCREEVAVIRRLAQTYQHRGFQIVGLALDEDHQAVQQFAKRNGIEWPLLAGTAARDWALRAGIDQPALLVVDADGRLTAVGQSCDEIQASVAAACGYAAPDGTSKSAVRQARRANSTNAATSRP